VVTSSDDDEDSSSSDDGEDSTTQHRLAVTSSAGPVPTSRPQHKKLQVESSIRQAVNGKNSPLLAWFKPCSWEVHSKQQAAISEQFKEDDRERKRKNDVIKNQRITVRREQEKLRQRKHRNKKREEEIIAGICSSGGRKRKIVPLELKDTTSVKNGRLEIPAETRPARAVEKKLREKKKKLLEKTRKPPGRKLVRVTRPAKYHNWFMPICWRLIEQARITAGWDMSASKIVKIAKMRNPEIFGGLARTTVREWIDRSGPRPRWSETTLEKVRNGLTPGHSNGGPRGIFVSRGKSCTCES
jgi:hypothetical protein